MSLTEALRSPLRRERQWVHSRGTWIARNTLVNTTHWLPRMAVTSGMMRLPALEYITEACSTTVSFSTFPNTVMSRKSRIWMDTAASRDSSSPWTSSSVFSIWKALSIMQGDTR